MSINKYLKIKIKCVFAHKEVSHFFFTRIIKKHFSKTENISMYNTIRHPPLLIRKVPREK